MQSCDSMFPLSRREWLAAAASGLAGVASRRRAGFQSGAGPLPGLWKEVNAGARRMFDQLGGIGSLVSGKTVAIKINMANPLLARTGYTPAWFTRWSHPDVIGAAVRLFGEARRRPHPHPRKLVRG